MTRPRRRRARLLNRGALVLNSDSGGPKLLQVLVGVVSTEQKLAVWHDRAHVGLCAAGIASIHGCQRLLINHRCVHIIIKAFRGENIPTLDREFTRGELRDRLSCVTEIDGCHHIFAMMGHSVLLRAARRVTLVGLPLIAMAPKRTRCAIGSFGR